MLQYPGNCSAHSRCFFFQSQGHACLRGTNGHSFSLLPLPPSPPSLCPITRPSLPPSLPRAHAFLLSLPFSTDFLVSAQGNVVAYLPTIGYMNMPGPPSDCGGTMICSGGALILTEDRIFMFGSNSNKEASASDYITGTTYCTSICCCFPCCYGNCPPKLQSFISSPLSPFFPTPPSPLPAPPHPSTPPPLSPSADTLSWFFLQGFAGASMRAG